MKKIVTAHLGNKVFQIEEDAYAYLNRFLAAHTNERELESQVANLLDEKIVHGKQVITFPDVVDVLYRLGFSASEMDSGKEKEKASQKLCRQTKGSMIGGVCAGFAEYFDMDPTLVRVLFVIGFFCGTIGFWTYLLLWIIIPKAS